jgi:phosphoribosylaminoimidazole-succinocarboxamide synthase
MRSSKTLYEGKAKKIIKGPKKNTLIQIFKDDATAYNKKKHKIFKGKGVLNNHISAHIMQYLKSKRIPTHFEEKLNDREQLIKNVKLFRLNLL